MRKNLSNKKRGNIFFIITIFIVIAIALGSFLRTSVSRSYSIKKLGETLMARELANSLAILSVHYLKNVELKKANSEFRRRLSLPIGIFKKLGELDEKSREIKINELNFTNSKNILDFLKNKDQSDLKIKNNITPRWRIPYADFNSYNSNTYPREKYGQIFIDFDITYELPGIKKTKTESYHFSTDIKVTANILPILSKFTLYVEDALKGSDDVNRFNVLDTDVNGDVISKKVYPWVLNNGGEIDTSLNTYEALVESNRGFVFLGGGQKEAPIQLGIAFGSINGNSEFGEGFHFFSKENSYWKTLENWGNNKGIMTANLGLCDDPSDVNCEGKYGYNAYFKLIGQDFNWARRNSIFKLYGTDAIPSPTLVFGYVDAMYASVREYRDSANKWDFYFLDYYGGAQFSNAVEEDEDVAYFANRFKEKTGRNLNYNIYRIYASGIESVRYNNDYGYALDKTQEWPLANIIQGDEFKKLCNIGNQSNDDVVYKIPNTTNARYEEIYVNAKLNELEKFIDAETLKFHRNETETIKEDSEFVSKVAYKLTFIQKDKNDKNIIKPDDVMYLLNSNEENKIDKSFKNFLFSKGTLKRDDSNVFNRLDLNGWLYIDSDDMGSGFELPLKLNGIKLESHGGIIVSKGKVIIKEDIHSVKDDTQSDKEKFLLTIVALDGDIVVKSDVKHLQCSLVSAKRQVKFEKSDKQVPDNVVEVNGNIVMQNLGDGTKKAHKDVGINRYVKLNYFNALSALPKITEETLVDKDKIDRTESSLLMFNLKDNPIME